MKRAIGLIFIIAVCVVGFLSLRGTLPFMPIFGRSMEPTIHSGALLMIQPVDPNNVKVGDIIVFNVPKAVSDYYNYPSTVAHRVIQVNTTPGLSFRTKGDNTGEDPFTIRPMDIRGTVGDQIPNLGLPLLFFQSQQGTIFVIVSLALLILFLYGGEISQGGSWIHRGIFSPVIVEEKRAQRILTRKIEGTEQKMNATEQALVKFSAAIELYAQHLASHTSAIQGLSEASHELKHGAAEQNRVLAAMLDNIQQQKATQQQATQNVPVDSMARLLEKIEQQKIMQDSAAQKIHSIEKMERVKSVQEKTLEKTPAAAPRSTPVITPVTKSTATNPPGCVRRKFTAEEILAKIAKVHKQNNQV